MREGWGAMATIFKRNEFAPIPDRAVLETIEREIPKTASIEHGVSDLAGSQGRLVGGPSRGKKV